MLQLDFRENNWQLVDQTLLFIVLSEDRRHLLFQIADDVGMDLQRTDLYRHNWSAMPTRELFLIKDHAIKTHTHAHTYPNQTCPLDQVVELA